MEQELGLPVHRLEETPKARVFAYQDEIDNWLERTQHSERKAFFDRSSLTKFIIPAAAVLFLTIISVVIWNSFLSKENQTTTAPGVNTSIAIVNFKNLTGDTNLDHWRRALPELLIYDLAQSRYLDVLPADKLFDVMNDLGLTEQSEFSAQELEQIAANAEIKNIIYGNFAKAGNSFRINASIRDFESGEDIHMESSAGIGEESFFVIVDELTGKIKDELEFSTEQVASDIDRDVEDITTSSPEALKYYSAGWNSHFKGDVQEGIRLMEKAVEIDTQFALAYRALGSLHSRLGQASQAYEYRNKAFELRDRVSDRERLSIESIYYALSEYTYERAIETAKEFQTLYPHLDTPYNLLGVVYWVTGNWRESLDYHESAFRISAHSVNWGNLITACLGNGYYARAEQIYKDYVADYSSSLRDAHRWMPEYLHLITGDYDSALQEAQRIFLDAPSSPSLALFRADISHFAGNIMEAKGEYESLLNGEESDSFEREARKRLASLYLMQGKFEAARDVLDEVAEQGLLPAASLQKFIMNFTILLSHAYLKANDIGKAHEALDILMGNSALDPDPIFYRRLALWGKGQIYRELHALDDLIMVSDELDQTEAPVMDMMGRWYMRHINGLLALEQGNTSEAIVQLEKLVALLPKQSILFVYSQHAPFLESLALAYFQAGSLNKALDVYEQITALTTGRLYFGDVYAEAFYMLGRICEQQGKKAKAVEHFERFLELRMDADPGIAEVEDARLRLDSIQ
jgi:tetratricopeptide (TPR) repeat protein